MDVHLNKDHFHLETIESTTDLINKLNDLMNEGNIFRGFSSFEQLYPSLIRQGLSDYEFDMLRDLEYNGMYLLNCNFYMDFLSTAQHYGIPTRLLDFTINPFVALYFSLYNKASKDKSEIEFFYIAYCKQENNVMFYNLPCVASILGYEISSFTQEIRGAFDDLKSLPNDCVDSKKIVDTNFYLRNALNDLSGFDKKEMNIRAFYEKEREKLKDNKLIILNPKNSNTRLVMQQGLFLVPYNVQQDKYEELIKNGLSLIRIPKSLRKELMDYLDILGINANRLMPDLGSISEAIKKEYIEKCEEKK